MVLWRSREVLLQVSVWLNKVVFLLWIFLFEVCNSSIVQFVGSFGKVMLLQVQLGFSLKCQVWISLFLHCNIWMKSQWAPYTCSLSSRAKVITDHTIKLLFGVLLWYLLPRTKSVIYIELLCSKTPINWKNSLWER